MQQYLLAMDVGVFSCKAILCTPEGEIVRDHLVLYDAGYGPSGLAWQSAEIWWDAVCRSCRALMEGIPAESVAAVCLCGQMMGCLPVDAAGVPLCDSIIWDDGRAVSQSEEIAARIGPERIHKITGVRSSPSYSLAKMAWLRENQPELYQKTACFLQCKDYINYKLCGRMVTDPSDAGFTQAYDLLARRWSEEVTAAAGISLGKLPEVVEPGTVLGHVTPEASAASGLSTRTLVVEGMGDGRAVVFGSGINQPGEGCVYLGASSWISQITRQENVDPENRLSKSFFPGKGLYSNGGTMRAGRLSADWFIKEFFSEKYMRAMQQGQNNYRFLDEQVVKSCAGSRGLLFMPYLMGERAPWWDSEAKGAFLGLRSTHTKYDFCRSVLEGVSFNLGLIKNDIERLEPITRLRMTGGGASSRQWQQILSDVFDRTIISTNVTGNVGCIGMAVMAGAGAGFYPDFSEISRFHRSVYTTYPMEAHVEIYRELIPAFEDCYHALEDVNQHLSRF